MAFIVILWIVAFFSLHIIVRMWVPEEEIWSALAAFGTVSAVIVAISLPFILRWTLRPKIEISFYEQEKPHLRQGGGLFYLSVRLVNTGRMVAKNAQPFITGKAEKNGGKWEPQNNWITVPILWGLNEDEVKQQLIGKIIEERDLIQGRPYFFNLGHLNTHDVFVLNCYALPEGRPIAYGPGESCFEITIYAEGVKVVKYFFISWSAGCGQDFEKAKKNVQVYLRDSCPWKK